MTDSLVTALQRYVRLPTSSDDWSEAMREAYDYHAENTSFTEGAAAAREIFIEEAAAAVRAALAKETE